MAAGWKIKATLEGADRLATFARQTQSAGQAIAELQRRTAAQAEGLRRLQEAGKRLAGLNEATRRWR